MGHLTGEYSETEFNDYSRSAERTPLKEGMFTETKTGKPISKLMGNYKDYDCGYTSVGTSPFNSLLMCNDFATLFTFIPISPLYTQVELMWLVHKDAEEGKDYNIEEMKWMWDVTTIADKLGGIIPKGRSKFFILRGISSFPRLPEQMVCRQAATVKSESVEQYLFTVVPLGPYDSLIDTPVLPKTPK